MRTSRWSCGGFRVGTVTTAIWSCGRHRFRPRSPLPRNESNAPNHEGQQRVTRIPTFGISLRAGLLSGLRGREGLLIVLVQDAVLIEPGERVRYF